jgi:uncharacterized OB-fold protein
MTDPASAPPSARPLPQPDVDTAFFWDATARRELHILRCEECETYIHPPKPTCRACGSTNLAPATVSGNGTVYSFTITHQPVPGFEPPFNVVLVELDEQRGLRLVSNLTGVAPEAVRIGMPVEVVFEPFADGVTLPLFRKRSEP